MIKHFSLFSGIESFKKAMTNLGIDNELVGYSEFDKYASVALAAIHGVSEDLNYGDITKIDETKLPDCDLITYGFPCQDISIAGLGKGIIEGETRSGLLYDALRIIKHKMPKYAIAENVKNLVGKKFKEDFDNLLNELDSYGYNNYWKVLNSKDYGIPQNRERVFVVSIRKDVDRGYEFPEGFDNGLRLKDFLLDEVENKYYIDNDKTNVLLSKLEEQDLLNGDRFGADSTINEPKERKISNCITARYDAGIQNQKQIGLVVVEPKVAVKEATKKGYDIATVGDSINISHPKSKTRRGRVGKEVAQTLDTGCNQATLVPRKDIKDAEIYCEFCGEELQRKRFNGRLEDFNVFLNRKFCSRDCMKKSYLKIGKNEQTYSNAHTTARKINEHLLGLEECQNCYGKENLDIHHIDGDWQNNELDNLTCLCRSCHMKVHVTMREQQEYRIRKLTPLEVWRLMGFYDEDYWKARKALEDKFYNGKDRSNSQMYKMAGNSIVVDVLEGILKNLKQEG